MHYMDANETNRILQNLIRLGDVTDVDHDGEKCRVSTGDLETDFVKWISLAAATTSEWLPPVRGEQVVLLCPGGDPAQAIALRGISSDAFPFPSHSPDTHTRAYPDGAIVEYDHAQHAYLISLPDGATARILVPGSVVVVTKTATVTADDIVLDAKQTTVNGPMLVKGAFVFENGVSGKAGTTGGPAMVISGTVAVSDDVIAGGKSGAHHSHMEQGDGQRVSEPI